MSLTKQTPERRREIARMGGIAAHAKGKAHKFTSETAKAAGHLGGLSVSKDREYMRRIGALGAAAKRRVAIKGA